MRQAESAQRVPDRRWMTGLEPSLGQCRLDLGQGDPGPGTRNLAQKHLVPVQKRPSIAADPRRRGAARRVRATDRLDRGRRAHLEAPSRLARRTASLDRSHRPPTKILE